MTSVVDLVVLQGVRLTLDQREDEVRRALALRELVRSPCVGFRIDHCCREE